MWGVCAREREGENIKLMQKSIYLSKINICERIVEKGRESGRGLRVWEREAEREIK